MLPSLRQRLIIGLAVAVGATSWLLVAAALRVADGSTGISITTAAVGPAAAALIMVVAAVPAVIGGLVVACTGNPLSGVFAVATALCIVAGWGGSIDEWIIRDAATPPGIYGWLIVEVCVWEAALLVTLALMRTVPEHLRHPLRALISEDHLNADVAPRRVNVKSAAAAAICASIGAVLSLFILRSTESGQVIWALILAFLIGGLAAHLIVPDSDCWAILLSPGLVAVVAYTWVLLSFDDRAPFLAAWYGVGRTATAMPGPALALPIHYASAALVGCTLGVGWAQGLNAARLRIVDA
jgi:hypothetical protein